MRFVPVKHLDGKENLALNITNANMQTLLKKGATLSPKILDRIQKSGVQSVYVSDPAVDDLIDEDVHDTISPELRSASVNQVMKSFDRFQSRVQEQRKVMKYGDSGQDLFGSIKDISNDLINEILLSKNTRVMMNDIKTTSDYHYKHSVNVAVLSLIIGTEMGLSTIDLQNLAYGALLSDFGMNFIDEAILLKEDQVTASEFKKIMEHVETGYGHINENTVFNAHVKSIIMHHHERMDGSGYPNGLKGDEIHPLARIVMIADVYDAMTSDRPYRLAHTQHEAIEYIMAHADTHFDFKIANIFARKIVPYPVGTYVMLSTDQQAVVIRNNNQHPLRPVVRLFNGRDLDENAEEMNLLIYNNVTIKYIIYKLDANPTTTGGQNEN